MARILRQLERAVLSRYPGVDASVVARLERVTPEEVDEIRERFGRRVAAPAPGDDYTLEFDDYARLMRGNRSAGL